jgi:hypothetical protein
MAFNFGLLLDKSTEFEMIELYNLNIACITALGRGVWGGSRGRERKQWQESGGRDERGKREPLPPPL